MPIAELFNYHEAQKWTKRIFELPSEIGIDAAAGHVEKALMSAFEKGVLCGRYGNLMLKEYEEVVEYGKHIHENNRVDDRCMRCGHDLRHIIHRVKI